MLGSVGKGLPEDIAIRHMILSEKGVLNHPSGSGDIEMVDTRNRFDSIQEINMHTNPLDNSNSFESEVKLQLNGELTLASLHQLVVAQNKELAKQRQQIALLMKNQSEEVLGGLQ